MCKTKFSTTLAAALLATAMIPAASTASSAASKNEDLDVKMTVNPMVLLFVTDSTLEMSASDISASELDATGQTVADGRAQFWVVSNTTYDITLEPAATWGDADALQVKFVGTTDPTAYIGGALFLDTDVSTDTPTEDGSDIETWNGTDGNVTFSASSRGVTRYGVGAIFDPQTWSGNADEDAAGAPSGAASIAPLDVYSTTVTVTVSSN